MQKGVPYMNKCTNAFILYYFIGCHEYGHFLRNCPQKHEIQQDKEEGWKTVKRTKTKHKSGEAQSKEGENASRKTNPKGSQETQKANETRDETNDTKEKSSNEETKELEKEAVLSYQSEKDFASLI